MSWSVLAGIGGLMFGGQFVFLFFAMEAGLPPGLTSVLADRRLAAEEELLADATAHREAAAAALSTLADDDGARDRLAAALAALTGRAPFEGPASRLHDVLADVDDVASELRALAEAIDEDPARLDTVRARRHLLRELCRKYGDDLDAVMAFHRDAAQRLAELASFDERAAELDERRRRALDAEREAAAAVGRARREAAPRLAAAVEAELQRLAMPNASIGIEVGAHDDDHPGDRVQFLLAANPGAPLLPLTRVASGGELARTMLALRLVLAGVGGSASSSDGARRTLVFDEVDAGIGGIAAQAIGDALATLGRAHQVLVVTHLAQVAAAAERHFNVDKTVREGATFATARVLDGDDRVGEIARMLSGTASASALDHARDLLGDGAGGRDPRT